MISVGVCLSVLNSTLTSHFDGAAKSYQCYVIVVSWWIVVSIRDDSVHIGTSKCAHVCPSWHHSPATQLLFTAARPKGSEQGGSVRRSSCIRTLPQKEFHRKWSIGKQYWPCKAVGSRDYPARRHQWASTCMLASLLQADLPGPVLDYSICTPHNTVLGAHLSTVWQKKVILLFSKTLSSLWSI